MTFFRGNDDLRFLNWKYPIRIIGGPPRLFDEEHEGKEDCLPKKLPIAPLIRTANHVSRITQNSSETHPIAADSSPTSGSPLFTSQFFLLCGFTFTTFISAFLLFPTMPFRILSLGKNKSQAGLFLGFITYASAFSAPLGGALADRVGKKPILLASSAAIVCFSIVYAQATQLWLILLTAVVHGVFWSALLASSAAMMIGIIPDARRAEGLGYWGLASTLAIAAAPAAGLWLLQRGWGWLCFCMGSLAVGMLLIALRFPEKRVHRSGGLEGLFSASLIEKRVFLLALTLFLYTFGYGGITSFVALYTRDSGVRPEGLFFSIFSVVIIVTRPFLGRLADKKGRTRVMFPCLALIAIGMGVLAISARLPFLVTSAVLFGIGFGSAYPAFAAYILEHVDARRRGAAFGSILLAVDTGIGRARSCLASLWSTSGIGPPLRSAG